MFLVCLLLAPCYGNAARLVKMLGILPRLSAFVLLGIGVQMMWNGLSTGILQILALRATL
jgi:small neutral amino acid transporter SnatA (MarC family)